MCLLVVSVPDLVIYLLSAFSTSDDSASVFVLEVNDLEAIHAFSTPCMPKSLIDAVPSYRGVEGFPKIDKAEYERRMELRERYLLRCKQSTPSGTNWMCPARGSGATVSRPLAGAEPPKAKK